MGQLKLSGELVETVQRAVMEADPEARDPGVVAQYLSAVIGVMLGNSDLPAERKDSILQQLYAFAGQVCNDVDAQRRQAETASQEAFGIWRPGQE